MDSEERARLEADSEWLFDRWHDDFHDRRSDWWYEIPKGAEDLLQEYSERGVELDYYTLLPDEVRHVQTLRQLGLPSVLRDHFHRLSHHRTQRALLFRAAYEDGLAFDRMLQRLQVILQEAEYAEKNLQRLGLTIDPETRILSESESPWKKQRYGNRAIRHVYRRLIGPYGKAWPEDTFDGKPKRNPKRLQEHIQRLLTPYLGRIPLDKIRNAIRYT